LVSGHISSNVPRLVRKKIIEVENIPGNVSTPKPIGKSKPIYERERREWKYSRVFKYRKRSR